MTGRSSRRRRSGLPFERAPPPARNSRIERSSNGSEGHDVGRWARRHQRLRSPSSSCPSRRDWLRPAPAPPRRAAPGAPDRPAGRAATVSSCASSSSRTAAPAATKASADLAEVLHVRPEHDGLAEHRRLEHVVTAGGARGCLRRTRPCRSGRPRPVRRSCPRRRCRREARRRWPGRGSGGGVFQPSFRHSWATSSKRSGCRGASTSSADGDVARTRRNARSTAVSSPFIVLPATIDRTRRRKPEVAQHAVTRADAVAGSSESNFSEPVTTTVPGSAPSSMKRRADSSLCTQKRSMSCSTRRMNGLISR